VTELERNKQTLGTTRVSPKFRLLVTLGGRCSFRLDCCGLWSRSNRSDRLSRCCGRGNVLGYELSNRLRELRALGGPVINAVAFEVDGSGISAGVVGADHFNRTAVAGAVLFNNDNAVVRLLTGANARQTNHQHRENPLRKAKYVQGLRQDRGSQSTQPVDEEDRTPKYRGF
jgi:hypothetical protein